ncbi:MAG: hypothetical protein ACTSQ9_01995 [Candidatus Hodarchaeales archaeon]
MGEYEEKITKHFWMSVCSSINETSDVKAYKEKFEPVFKIKTDKAILLVEDRLWSVLFSLTRKITDPDVLHKQLGSIVKIDTGKVRENIWKLLILSMSGSCDENTFREHFEPIFKIDIKKAILLVEDHLWAALYSLTKKIQDPDELSRQFKPLAQLNINRAAETIKEDNPEKHKFLQIYK